VFYFVVLKPKKNLFFKHLFQNKLMLYT